MTPSEAHAIALEAATNLAKWGVDTLITPSLARKDPHILSKCASDRGVKPGYWVNVRFTPTTHRESDMIVKVRKGLNCLGIHFGVKVVESYVDHDDREHWYLDHSFEYIEE